MNNDQPTFTDFFNNQVKYLDHLFDKSKLLLKNLNNNISGCGDEIEFLVRDIFTKALPERFKVTHGYIANAKDNHSEPLLSPQVDLIIVDTLVPHKLFIVDDIKSIEVVPKEAVVGIIEIKRTLTKDSLIDAANHLKDIIKTVEIKKDDKSHYIPGGHKCNGITTGIYNNPLLGIISIEKDSTTDDEFVQLLKDHNIKCDLSFLDIVASLKNMVLLTANKEKITTPFRTRDDQELKDKEILFAGLERKDDVPGYYIARTIGFILLYLGSVSGSKDNIGNYFFNSTI